MKKVLLILVAAFVGLGLTACTPKDEYKVNFEFTKGETMNVEYGERIDLKDSKDVKVTDSNNVGVGGTNLSLRVKSGENVLSGGRYLQCNTAETTVVEYKVTRNGKDYTKDRSIVVAPKAQLGPNIYDKDAVSAVAPIYGGLTDAQEKPGVVSFWSIQDTAWNLGPISEAGASFTEDKSLKLTYKLPAETTSWFAAQWFLAFAGHSTAQYGMEFSITASQTRSVRINGNPIELVAGVKQEVYITTTHSTKDLFALAIQVHGEEGAPIIPGEGYFLIEDLYIGKLGDVVIPDIPVNKLDNYFVIEGINNDYTKLGDLLNHLGVWYSADESWGTGGVASASLAEKDGKYELTFDTTKNQNQWGVQVLLHSKPIAEEGTYVVSFKISTDKARSIGLSQGWNNPSSVTGITGYEDFAISTEEITVSFEVEVKNVGDTYKLQLNAGALTSGKIYLSDFSFAKKA